MMSTENCPDCLHWSSALCRRCVDNNRFKPGETPEDVARLNDLLLLKLRNAVADKEWIIASANMHTATNGRWLCNWHEDIQETDVKIQKLITEIEAQ